MQPVLTMMTTRMMITMMMMTMMMRMRVMKEYERLLLLKSGIDDILEVHMTYHDDAYGADETY